jgi:hypothetical protein
LHSIALPISDLLAGRSLASNEARAERKGAVEWLGDFVEAGQREGIVPQDQALDRQRA